jgi:hypothetical protein
MVKLDWKKDLKKWYFPPAKPVLVDLPPVHYLMIDGRGDPNNNPSYQAAVEALFSLSYAIKFALKKSGLADYAVFPAEGLWWADDMEAFSVEDKSAWHWTMMIAQPDAVMSEWVERARGEVVAKKGITAAEQVRFEAMAEGRCAQLMHTGPYSAEGPSVARLHAFIDAQGLRRSGKHHEIYLGDARRTAPEKLKTVLRQPVAGG